MTRMKINTFDYLIGLVSFRINCLRSLFKSLKALVKINVNFFLSLSRTVRKKLETLRGMKFGCTPFIKWTFLRKSYLVFLSKFSDY